MSEDLQHNHRQGLRVSTRAYRENPVFLVHTYQPLTVYTGRMQTTIVRKIVKIVHTIKNLIVTQ